MNKIWAMLALLIGLSACNAGIGIGNDGQPPTHVATDAWGSAVAQMSIGTVAGD